MVYMARCAWCGKFLRSLRDDRETESNREPRISHGICPDCRQAFLTEGRRYWNGAAAVSGPGQRNYVVSTGVREMISV